MINHQAEEVKVRKEVKTVNRCIFIYFKVAATKYAQWKNVNFQKMSKAFLHSHEVVFQVIRKRCIFGR